MYVHVHGAIYPVDLVCGSILFVTQRVRDVTPTKIAGRLYHHGLIKLIVQELLQRTNVAWTFFLFWNEFDTEL